MEEHPQPQMTLEAAESRAGWFRVHRYSFYLPLIALFAAAAALAHLHSITRTPTELPKTFHHPVPKTESPAVQEEVKGVQLQRQPATPIATTQKNPEPAPVQDGVTLTDFAKCLGTKRATMYGASWCPHCQNEKKSFGSAWSFVPYVECTENPDACAAAGITGYPTWVLANGQMLLGEQSLDGFAKLSQGTSCPAPTK